jgi:lysophospholipase L1-like esterase
VSWSVVLLVAAAVAVTAFSGYLLATWPPDPPPAPPVAGEEPTGAASPTTSPTASPATEATEATEPEDEPRLVVLGDSFSAESTESAGPEWPTLLGESLGWEVQTQAVTGSGYLAAGTGRPFGARVPAVVRQSPDVIVVAGGVSDLGAYPVDRIVTAADNVVARLARQSPDAQLVLVSPFSNGDPGPLTRQLSAQLRQIARLNDAAYVDATRWLTDTNGLFGDENDQPTDLGQGVIADRMEAGLAELGVTDAVSP